MIDSTPFNVRPRPSEVSPTLVPATSAAIHVAGSADTAQAPGRPSNLDPAQVWRLSAPSKKLDERAVRPALTDLLTRRPELRAVAFADTLDAIVRWSA
jgi:hypothetical protein